MSIPTLGPASALPLADRLRQALESVLDHATEANEVRAEALAEAALHCFGVNSVRKSWGEDARAFAELVKAIGYVADKNYGGPCAIPPGIILGMKPNSLADRPARALRVVTDDRAPDLNPDGTPHRVYDERNGWGG